MNYAMQPYQQSQYNPYMQPGSWQAQRIAELEQRLPQYQMPQYPQQPITQTPQVPAPFVAMVTSIDEVRAYNVADGAKYLFIDTANDKIYARQIDYSTGKSEPVIYERTTPAEVPPVTSQPANEVQELRDQLGILETKYNTLEERLNVQSANVGKSNGAAESNGGTSNAGVKSGNAGKRADKPDNQQQSE